MNQRMIEKITNIMAMCVFLIETVWYVTLPSNLFSGRVEDALVVLAGAGGIWSFYKLEIRQSREAD